MMEAKALWHLNAEESIIDKAQLAEQQEDLVTVRSLYSLISTGTERLVASGGVPENLYQQMTVPYMEGGFQFPIKYGYSLVGEIDQVGHDWHGQKVHLLHPICDRQWMRWLHLDYKRVSRMRKRTKLITLISCFSLVYSLVILG